MITAMSPVAHLQYGWWFAHWSAFTRKERAFIALAGAGPDLDGLALFGGGDAYHRYHHILFHNVGSLMGASAIAGVFLWRSPRAWLFTAFAFAMHIVEDYFTVAWNQYPWRPFSDAAVNLGDHWPVWMVQGVLQSAAMAFVIATTIWIYWKYGRTPLEIFSPRLDRLLTNYAVLPWRNRCALCERRAHFRCECGTLSCATHAKVASGLSVRCVSPGPPS
jgi:hypothetical protein